ncbi:DUF6174 domain-containing protein [Nocardioides montaniterrae]
MGHQRRLSIAAITLALLAPLAGCGKSEDAAKDPASDPTSSATATSSSTSGTYPTLAATDYSYRLQVFCYCSLVGPVDVTVRAGKVVSARIASGPSKGKPAPASYTHLTINEIIAKANEANNHAKVIWPQGATVPQRVTVSPVTHTADAQITYVIKRYVSAG